MNFQAKARGIINNIVAKKTLSLGIGKCEKILSDALEEAYKLGKKEVEAKVLTAITREGKTTAKKSAKRGRKKKTNAQVGGHKK